MKFSKDENNNLIEIDEAKSNVEIWHDEESIVDSEINKLMYDHRADDRSRFAISTLYGIGKSEKFSTFKEALSYFNSKYDKIPNKIVKEFTKYIVDKYIIGK